MKIRMYSVFDVKAESYTQPFYSQTDGQATRSFVDLIQDTNHPFGKHPYDYTLFMIGTFDDQNGHMEPITPISLGNGVEFQTPEINKME